MDRCGGELGLSVCKAKEVSSRTQRLILVLQVRIGSRVSLLHESGADFPEASWSTAQVLDKGFGNCLRHS